MTHKASEDMKAKIEPIKSAKESLVNFLNGKLAEGMEKLDAGEVGEVTDMIKDLSEAENACWEACYHKSIVEAMEKADEDEKMGYPDGRMGYDRWRYASGRFAPKGRGTYGYMPPYMNGPDFYDEIEDGMMGYSDGTPDRRNGRMGYTPNLEMTDDMTSREKMDKAIDVIGDIWASASTEDRSTMKTYVEDLLHQMQQA